MEKFEYSEDDLFDRCYRVVDEKKKKVSSVKGNPIKPIVEKQNRKTRISNFPDVCKSLNRDIDEVKKFILSELSTQGSITENNCMLLNGLYKPSQVIPIITKYVNTRVCCIQCKSRNTIIKKENRITYVDCSACRTRNAIE